MAWYRTGTVAVTGGSPNVVGTGTLWASYSKDGDGMLLPDGKVYEVLDVVDNTHITLATNYGGSTASGQAYGLFPTHAYSIQLASQVTQLIGDYSAYVTGPGAGKFSDGTVGAPGQSWASDTDTGFYRPGANSVSLALGGLPAVTWTTAGMDVRAANGAAIVAGRTDNAVVGSEPGYFDIAAPNASGAAKMWVRIKAVVTDATNASEDADLVVMQLVSGSLTEVARWSSSNLGLGTQSPAQLLHLKRDTNGFSGARIENSNTGAAAYYGILLNDGSGTKGMLIQMGSAYTTANQFVQEATVLNAGGAGGISLASPHASGAIRFYSGGVVERAQLNPAGQVLVGQTSATGDAKIQVANGVRFGGTLSSDPNTLDFYQEGTFTPTIAGTTTAGTGTYTTQVGRYTRIGNLVHFQVQLVWTAHTGTGSMYVSGLPFASNANNTAICTVRHDNLTMTAGKQLVPIIGNSATGIVFRQVEQGTSALDLPIDTAATIQISGTYEV